MTADLLTLAQAAPPDAALLMDADGALTYGAALAQAVPLGESWRDGVQGRRALLRVGSARNALLGMLALQAAGAQIFLLDINRSDANRLVKAHGVGAVVNTRDGLPQRFHRFPMRGEQPGDGAQLVFFTSGTTGEPKAVAHRWETLLAPARRDARYAGTRWLGSFPPTLYAGLQLLVQVVANGATLVAPPDNDPRAIAAVLADQHVEYAAASPTFWRRLLRFGGPAEQWGASLRGVTLGGEAADQTLLDELCARLPHVRVSHIFATSEHGRCFAVHDGQAGFPADWLNHPLQDGVMVQTRDDQLWIRPVHGMAGYAGGAADAQDDAGWRPTGDRVAVAEGRVRFLGRDGEMINVGGHKVAPLDVERVLAAVPGVAEILVYGRPSQVTGEIPAADVVPAPGVDGEALLAELKRAAHATLPPQARPRQWRVVEALAVNAAGKAQRPTQD
ncbi:ANL family adenylate-forming protein [Magnetofaba australis]|uniref:Long-chain-fatty-acid--CoA ligase n=1 Tax=Magnetofaba australis IT-1 TaxID=1434232 RepID=A0A1Y2JZ51_9PROT|nr:fatty acid--CoA ligase family protein [Magnetofaba australis]OSM00177.1 putative AMP-dependent synthetase/ligase [Magnetofaba australis IT-1]